MFKLDPSNLEDSLKKCRREIDGQKRKLLEIMRPFLTEDLDHKKQIELAHIAKFVHHQDCTIVKVAESPDFITSDDGRMTGVEVRQLNTARAEFNGYIQNLFDAACREFIEQFPHEKMLVNFWISPNFIYKGSEKASLIARIVEFIHDRVRGLQINKPSFIDRIEIQPYSDISFHFNEGAHMQEVKCSDMSFIDILSCDLIWTSNIVKSLRTITDASANEIGPG
jgi:hypothetical protein